MAKKNTLNISIKHYLNTKLKPRSKDYPVVFNIKKEFETYPLYVQIIVKGQNTRIRSQLGPYVSLSEFDDWQIANADSLEKEKSILRKYITEISTNDPDFDGKHLFVSGEVYKYQFDLLVGKQLTNKVYDALQSLVFDTIIPLERTWQRAWFNDLPERRLTDAESNIALNNYYVDDGYIMHHQDIMIDSKIQLKNLNDANFISLLLGEHILSLKNLRKTFKSEFWDLESYVAKIKLENNVQIITIDDWFSGEFDRLFMITWKDVNALQAIHDGFDTLRESCKPSIKAFLDLYDPKINFPF